MSYVVSVNVIDLLRPEAPLSNSFLRLKDEGRELVFKGNLKRRGGQGDNGDLQVFLFDHALLMVKQKDKHKHEQYKVYRRVSTYAYIF